MIRRLQHNEVSRLNDLAFLFFKECSLPGNFNPATFNKALQTFIERGMGIFFVSEKDGKIEGAIGGTISQDFLTGDLVASEIFWFVHPDCRGEGLKLFLKFEEDAKNRGAKRILMLHLNTKDLSSLY